MWAPQNFRRFRIKHSAFLVVNEREHATQTMERLDHLGDLMTFLSKSMHLSKALFDVAVKQSMALLVGGVSVIPARYLRDFRTRDDVLPCSLHSTTQNSWSPTLLFLHYSQPNVQHSSINTLYHTRYRFLAGLTPPTQHLRIASRPAPPPPPIDARPNVPKTLLSPLITRETFAI